MRDEAHLRFMNEPEKDSPTWPYVLAFAKRMEAKLAKNRHKGDREGWLKDHPLSLCARIGDESRELYEAIEGTESAEVVSNEAADVANFAMMVADSYSYSYPFRGGTLKQLQASEAAKGKI